MINLKVEITATVELVLRRDPVVGEYLEEVQAVLEG